MSEKPRVVATTDLPFSGAYLDMFQAVFSDADLVRVDRNDSQAFALAMREAEIAILGSDIDADMLGLPCLRWVHVNIAGKSNSAMPALFNTPIQVTGAAGRSAPALAEHAMMFMLALTANLPGFLKAQSEQRWGGVPGAENLRALFGQTVGIIGVGATGLELAPRAKAFGMTVLGYRRRVAPLPDGFDTVYTADTGQTIDEIVALSDFIVLAINLSDATHHLIDARQLQRMKPGAFLINLARGEVVDEEALVRALDQGTIGGAGLDVFGIEPLPPGHPLWRTPNTIITPHFTAAVPDRLDRTLGIIAENYRRYRAREPLKNLVTAEDVFTKA